MGQSREAVYRPDVNFSSSKGVSVPVPIVSSGRVAMNVDTSSLLGKCPIAELLIAGLPVHCVLDTGAETSLVTYQYYFDHLREKLNNFNPDGKYIRVVGANNLSIPVIGVIEVPVTIGGQTVTATLLVRQKDQGHHTQYPILLGCNTLRKLMKIIDLDKLDSDWRLTFAMMNLDGHTEVQQSQCSSLSAPVVSRDRWEAIPGNSVRIMECHLSGVPNSCVLLEQPDLLHDRVHVASGINVIEGCQKTEQGQVKVLLCNSYSKPCMIPPFSRLADATVVDEVDQVFVNSYGSEIQVEVRDVLGVGQSGLNSDQMLEESVYIGQNMMDSCDPDSGASLRKPIIGDLSPEELRQVHDLLDRHSEAFAQSSLDLGMCDLIPHEIRLLDNRPVNLPFRRIPPHLLKEVRDQIQALLDKGIIQKSSSEYASPIVPVRKKDGRIRICVDYRQLNHKTTKDAFPLPRIEESLEMLGGASLFSSLDLAHGYFQLLMHPNSAHLTAFRVPWGLFQFNRLPQGLCTSPSTFQRVMEYLFSDMNMVKLLLYLDDVLVFSSSFTDHLERLEEVLTRLKSAGLKLNGKKCKLFQSEVTYLGHVVSSKGIAVEPSKIDKIRLWPVPQNQEQLASFLGLASYHRRFISGFSKLAAPLHALKCSWGKGGNTGSTMKVDWTPEADLSFQALKQALTNAPVLAYPKFDRGFVLEVDASFKGLGACLSQYDDNDQLHPVCYASRGLRGSERRYPDYSSFKLELLGLKWAVVDKFGDLLLGHHCEVLTDNNPLAHLRTARLGATEQRWVAKLAPYNLTIKYRSGRTNLVADALSRHPLNAMDVDTVLLVNHVTATSPVPHVLTSEVRGPSVEKESADPSISGVLPTYTRAQLSQLQQDDDFIGRIWRRKVSGWELGQDPPDRDVPGLYSWLREYDRYVFRKELLYHSFSDPIDNHSVYRLLVPQLLQSVLLETAHDKWGHQGVARTYSILKSRCYWPGMHSQVKSYIRRCVQCTVAKAPLPKIRPAMQHLLAFKPLELLAIDFVKLDRGKGGIEDVLVMTDAFTKWAQAVACKDQSAVTVARKLRDHWFSLYGVPVRLHSDQGRCFEGQLVHQLCSLYGIRKSKTSCYHAQGNGQTERFNRTLIGLIKSLESTHRKQWPDMLPHLVHIYNTTPHTVTGVSPYTLMFGREPRIPLDHILNNLENDWSEDYVTEQSSYMEKAWSIVRDRLEQAAAKSKQRYDRKARSLPLEPGCHVLLQKTGFRDRHKLEDHFLSESYVITACNAQENLCEIRPILGGPSRWVNRKMIILDPRQHNVVEGPDIDLVDDEAEQTSSSSEEEPEELPNLYLLYDPPDELDPPPELPPEPHPEESVLRRSERTTKGQHSNVHKELRSAVRPK